jgi:hypothetical protein
MIASNSFVVHRPRIEKQLTKAVPSAEKLPLAEGVVKELAATCLSLLLEKTPHVEEKTFQQVMNKHFDLAPDESELCGLPRLFCRLICPLCLWPSGPGARLIRLPRGETHWWVSGYTSSI